MTRSLTNVASQALNAAALGAPVSRIPLPVTPSPRTPKTAAARSLPSPSSEPNLPLASASSLNATPPFIHTGALAPFSIEWAAGFADGEACIHVARQKYRNGRRDTFVLRVAIVQNDLQSLQRFQQGLGIHAGIYAVKRVLGQNRQCYTLNYNGPHAMQLILLLGPFLVRKRMEAVTAWQFWVHGQAGKRFGPRGMPAAVLATRERLYWKLRSLK